MCVSVESEQCDVSSYRQKTRDVLETTHLDIVSKLQVVGKRDSMRSSDIAKSFKVVHGEL